MSFIVRRNAPSVFVIGDLGVTVPASSEYDLHSRDGAGIGYDDLIRSADLATAFITLDLERLDGPGGSVIPATAALNDAIQPHSRSHESGQPDELNVDGLAGELSDPQNPKVHGATAHAGQMIGTHSQLSGINPTDHHDNSNDPTSDQKAALDNAGLINAVNPVVSNATLQTHISIANPHNTMATDIADFDTEVSNNPDVAANTAHSSIITGNPHGTTATDVGAIPTSEKGAPNGVATLNGSGVIPASQLDIQGALDFQGLWNANTNTPTLTSGVGTKNNYYKVSVAGSTNLDGETDWQSGDLALFNGTAWEKLDQTNAVTLVNGQSGVVTLTTTNINEGTNLYYTETRVSNNSTVLANSNHVVDTNNPHNTDKAAVGLGEVQNIKSNFAATAPPGVGDDASQGYSVGSRWYDTANDLAYECHDASLGVAIWKLSTNDGGGLLTPVSLFEGSYSGSLSIPESWTNVPISTEDFKDPEFTHTGSSEQVTITEIGRYSIVADAQFDSDVNNRVFYGIRLQEDSGGGYTTIARSERQGAYARNTAIGETCLSTPIVTINVTAPGYLVKAQVQREASSSNGTTLLTRATLRITKLQGLKGDPGPQGPPGATQIEVKKDGASLGTNFTSVDFQGFNDVVDLGSGQAQVQSNIDNYKTSLRIFDHFTDLSRWTLLGTPEIVSALGGQVELLGGERIQSAPVFSVAGNMIAEWRFRLTSTDDYVELGFRSSTTNEANINTTDGNNWVVETKVGGSTTSTVTSVTPDTNWHIARIESNGTSVTFFIDGVQVASHTTNLPSGILFAYFLTMNTNSSVRIDWVELIGDLE
jgi:hypothetical protein